MAGLVSVVKDLTSHVNHVTQTIGEMARAVPGAPNSDNTQGLRMPTMQLPSFCRDTVVQDDISEFLERITVVSPTSRFAYESFRLRLESIPLRPICQFAYVLNSICTMTIIDSPS